MGAYGRMFIGKVESLGGQSIKTEFYVWGVPLVPLRSMYVLARKGLVHFGYPIPLHLTSVVAGYLRWYGWLPAFCIFVFGASALGDPQRGWIIRALGDTALLLCVVIAFLLIGRVWGLRRRQRLVLGHVKGLFAWPSELPVEVCQGEMELLRSLLAGRQIRDDPIALAVRPPPDEMAPFVFALAVYGQRLSPDAGWQQVAEALWHAAHQVASRPEFDSPVKVATMESGDPASGISIT